MNAIKIQNQRRNFSELMRIYEHNYNLFMQLCGIPNAARKPTLDGFEKRIGNKRYRIRIQEFERGSWTSNCSLECDLMNIRNDQLISPLFNIPLRIYLDSKQIQVTGSDFSLLKLLKINASRDEAIVRWHLNHLLNNMLSIFCEKVYTSA